MLPEDITPSCATEEAYIEVRHEGSGSDDDEDSGEEEEVIVAPSGEVFYADGTAVVETDSSSDEDEDEEEPCTGRGVAGPEWEGWPTNGVWGQPEAMVDPYAAMMFGFGMQVYEEETSDSSEDW